MQPLTLADKTIHELIRLIREEKYSPGQKLPNEYALSERLGVGRNTIREALRVLAFRNIVEIRQGAGTFVSAGAGVPDDPLGFSFIDDKPRLVRDLLAVRCMLEPQLAAWAAENASTGDIERLRETCEETECLIAAREDFSQADRAFHIQLARCSHNIVMSRIIPVIAAGVTFFSETVTTQEYEQTVRAHRQIYEAVRDRRPSAASQTMHYHLLYNQSRFLEEQRF